MTTSIILKTCVVWLAILLLAVVNGGFREAVLLKIMGQQPANLISGLLLGSAIVLMAWWLVPWIGVWDRETLIYLGLIWLLLTLVFEFSLGFAQRKTLSEMRQAYRFKNGNTWPLILLITAIAPYGVGWLRGWFC